MAVSARAAQFVTGRVVDIVHDDHFFPHEGDARITDPQRARGVRVKIPIGWLGIGKLAINGDRFGRRRFHIPNAVEGLQIMKMVRWLPRLWKLRNSTDVALDPRPLRLARFDSRSSADLRS